MTLILLLAFFVLLISFTCSLLEAVILSISPAYVAVAVEQKRRSGPLLLHLTEQIDRPLSAVLTMNTICHTLGSAAIAYQVHSLYGDSMVTLASVLLTFCILIFSEIIPKSLGASHWKTLAPAAAYMAQTLILMLYPFVFLSEKLSSRLRPATENPEVTREEVIMTAELGAEEGSIKTKESNIIKNLLMLDKMYVSDIMTPRSVFFALEGDMTVEEVMAKYKPIRFSRVPVYNGSLDNIVGMTHRYQILEALSHDQHERRINELTTPISTVPERMTVSQALDFFIREKEHLALAIDEYGVTTGLVTLEDAVETLLGVEIVDEFDHIEDMRKYALEQWQMRKQKMRR
ncbi:MAG: HlyC/CorC family transporter [Bdellovibrionaceae bacterium]|nr:HlyC/CorC family transporter [Pseudobdellovibrionaceae bacterium]